MPSQGPPGAAGAAPTQASAKGEAQRAEAEGVLHGLRPGSTLPVTVNLYDPNNTLERLFGSLAGGPLIEAILMWYQVAEMDVAWFSDNAGDVPSRNVVRSPLSRELQECTVSAYADRIQKEGLTQIVAGWQAYPLPTVLL